MKAQLVLVLLAGAVGAGCTDRAAAPVEATLVADGTDAAESKSDSVCVHRGKSCTTGGALACCTGFCSANAYTYSGGTCVAPLADGEYCADDGECKSKHCVSYTCVAQATVPPPELVAACTPTGKHCATDGECCAAGDFCLNFVYAPAVCTPPQNAGANCTVDKQCQSGSCVDYQCAGTICNVVGSACGASGSAPCCDGSYCESTGYGPFVRCQPTQPLGAWCYQDAACQSKHCDATTYRCAQ